jgi:hypothetical protein
MARVISAIAPRRPLARRRPRRSASAVEAFGELVTIVRRRADMDRACFIPAAVVTMRAPASANAMTAVPDHEDGGHESPTPAAMATSSDAVPTTY